MQATAGAGPDERGVTLGERWRRWRPGFPVGLICGCLCLIGLREAIVESTVPDWIVAPLLVPDTAGDADAIVVLGAGVVGDCVPNLNGVRRVLLGARLWRAGRAPIMVFTGGTGDGPCPVAESMARLALEVGVTHSATVVETASKSTHENGTLTLPLLQQLRATRVLLVTDRLHMRRAAGTFARLGLTVERASVPIYEGHVNNVDMLLAGAREFVALAYYGVRGWLGDIYASGPFTRTVGVATTAKAQRRLANPAGPIVLLGASYARGWPLAEVAGITVVNRGAAGHVSTEMLERFERDVVAARPRAVIIWGFINDIFRADPAQIDDTLDRVRQNFTTMIELAEKNGIEPILATEVTVRPDDSWTETLARWVGGLMGKESYQARINRHVLAVNGWLIATAGQKGLMVLDLQSVLAEEGGVRRREFTADDGSHITPAGYAALSADATPMLEAHFGSR